MARLEGCEYGIQTEADFTHKEQILFGLNKWVKNFKRWGKIHVSKSDLQQGVRLHNFQTKR